MIVVSANNITKMYGVDTIIKDVSFHINQGDRIGLIGSNGAGKTTLMKILTREMSYESGDFFIANDTSIGYLKQNDGFNTEKTVIEEVNAIFSDLHILEEKMTELSQQISEKSDRGEDVEKLLHKYDQMNEEYERKEGYQYKSNINGILSSMAFTEDFYIKKISSLSGGERTRLALACLLLKKPDILFLDEPTNHLDIGTLKWLEQYLKAYIGTILLVSHDRYFLDQTVNRIFEIENNKLYCYDGNYSTFAEKKRLRRQDEWRKYQQQQREVDRQEDLIRRFKERGTEKLAKRAASREKRLEHLERVNRPDPETGKMKLHFKQNFKSGNDVLLGEELAKSFGYGQNKRQLFSKVSFDIKRGERICMVGANGVGKTTLLKIMMGILEPEAGRLKTGHNVAFGYYDQGQQLLNDGNSLLEELKDSYKLYTDTEMRSLLGRFLFKNEMVFLTVGSLSGGERARLSLLKLMLSGSNVLVLDEPTNHLDINSKEIIEEALLDFPGTLIVVSHDRYFLSKIPTRILELTTDGITEYLGSYNYYVEKKQTISSGKKYLTELSFKEENGTKQELPISEQRRLNKEKEAEDRRKERLIKQLEQEINMLEEAISSLETDMCKEENLSSHVKLAQWAETIQRDKKTLEEKYNKWLEMQ